MILKMKPATQQYIIGLIMHCMSLILVYSAKAQVLFDFDNAPLHSSLPITQTVNGVTAHFTATGQGFSIQEAGVLGFTPQGFSGYVMYPNSIYLADLVIKFQPTIIDFSIMYACQELGCDDAATMRVTAYLNGTFIGTNTKTASNPGTWPVDMLSCTFAQGFDSVVVHYDAKPATCQDYGTIFMADNMQVTPTAALPVTLMYFRCESDGNNAVLRWKSAEEVDLSCYIVQFAEDGGHFRDLARINPEGPNSDYKFTHRNVYGTAYYRLKMLDQDSAYKYSVTRKLSFGTQPAITIVPNPSNDHIRVYINDAYDLMTVQIFYVDGVVVKNIKNYLSGQAITVSDLPKGIYILRLFSLKDEASFEKIFSKM